MEKDREEHPKLDLGQDEAADPPVRVEDRRFSARQEGDEPSEVPERDGRPAFVEQLEKQLRDAETRRDEVLSAHRRMQQEFEESRARLNRDVEARVDRARAATFRGILEIADHLDRALEAATAAGDDGPLAEGVRLIQAELLTNLRNEGLERLEVVGKPFDPEIAEAVAVVEVVDPQQHDQVIQEMRPGYRMGDLTVRPAQVQVGRATPGVTPQREES